MNEASEFAEEQSNESLDEVVLTKTVSLHRLNIKEEMLVLFQQTDITTFELRIEMFDARGRLEEGVGSGVLKEAFCLFFTEFFLSNTTGREDKVPSIRHDMTRIRWDAVARMIVYLLKWKVDYFPLALSPAFMMSTLFGDEKLSNDVLLNSFKNYISLEEKDLINSVTDNFEDVKEEIIEMLSDYNCQRIPTKENFRELLVEIAHAEIVQKPRYISNCFHEIFRKFCMNPVDTPINLIQYYEKRSPSAKKVIKCLKFDSKNENERNIFNYLSKYLKSISKDDLSLFLRFVTGGDLLPDHIDIEIVHQEPRAPRARTCAAILTLSPTYSCFNELAEEFGSILKSPESFAFSFI